MPTVHARDGYDTGLTTAPTPEDEALLCHGDCNRETWHKQTLEAVVSDGGSYKRAAYFCRACGEEHVW